ncbi:hypothetical protein B0H14DRAFT_2635127 [Mycena olivaceomarginata]|nr:hypothetical protein B0H14DRAFT_2635127 [Mycena olivaceomarginata]
MNAAATADAIMKRVVTWSWVRGRKCQISLQKTADRGWGTIPAASQPVPICLTISGVFAVKTIEPGTFVGVYSGVLFNRADESKLSKLILGSDYAFELDFPNIPPTSERYVVDGANRGNFTRYICYHLRYDFRRKHQYSRKRAAGMLMLFPKIPAGAKQDTVMAREVIHPVFGLSDVPAGFIFATEEAGLGRPKDARSKKAGESPISVESEPTPQKRRRSKATNEDDERIPKWRRVSARPHIDTVAEASIWSAVLSESDGESESESDDSDFEGLAKTSTSLPICRGPKPFSPTSRPRPRRAPKSPVASSSTLPRPLDNDIVPQKYWYLLEMGCTPTPSGGLHCYSPVCTQVTKNCADMDRHVKKHRRAEAQVFCSGCPKTFARKDSLERHVLRKGSLHTTPQRRALLVTFNSQEETRAMHELLLEPSSTQGTIRHMQNSLYLTSLCFCSRKLIPLYREQKFNTFVAEHRRRR